MADWEPDPSDDEWEGGIVLDGLQEDHSMRADFAQHADWDDERFPVAGLQDEEFSPPTRNNSPPERATSDFGADRDAIRLSFERRSAGESRALGSNWLAFDNNSASTDASASADAGRRASVGKAETWRWNRPDQQKPQLQLHIPQSAGWPTSPTMPVTPRSSRSGAETVTTGGAGVLETPRSSGPMTPRRYKWDVKPGGSYVPEAPSAMRQSDSKETLPQQRRWEVKFAPHVATASRRTTVMTSDVQTLMDQFQDVSQLRTATGGSRLSRNVNGLDPISQDRANRPLESPKAGAEPMRLDGLQAECAESTMQGAGRSGETAAQPVPRRAGDESQSQKLDGGRLFALGDILPEAAERTWQAEDFEECYAHDMVDGLLQMLKSQDPSLSAKAAAALCNLCAESEPNREQVIKSGSLTRLIDMLSNPSAEVPFMQSAAAACLCNLAANPSSKVTIAQSGAIEVLVKVLRSNNVAAAAQAAGALWSLCVDNDENKQLVSDAEAIPHLVQAAGALSECSIRNDRNKMLVSNAGTIPYLVAMLKKLMRSVDFVGLQSEDLNVRRLASCALCNVCANHDGNKQQAREAGALPILVELLSDRTVAAVLTPIAGAICNLSMKNADNKQELIRLGAINVLRQHAQSPAASLRSNVEAALNQLEGKRS